MSDRILIAAFVTFAVLFAIVLLLKRGRRESFSFKSILNFPKKILGIGGGGGYKPTFVGRQKDSETGYWICPPGTIDTGRGDSEACVSSTHMPPVWRWCEDDKVWGHCCPNGTVPAPETDWNKKCLVGYQKRVLMDGSYKCPPGTEDTGNDWNKSPDWHSAQQQCKRTGPYTLRMFDQNKWVCPPGTKDTGKTWGKLPGEAKQCLFCEGDACK